MEGFLGMIIMGGWNFAPNGWATCDGQIMSIAQNTALFSLLGTTYGGNGVNTFALPDLRGRVPIHWGTGPGLSPYVIGEQGGSENVTLLSTQIPAHSHSVNAVTAKGNQPGPAGHLPAADAAGVTAEYSNAAASTTMSPAMIAPAGGSQPHANVQPFLSVTFVIALVGIFPSRA